MVWPTNTNERKGERGFGFIEVLIAGVIMGVIAVTFIVGQSAALKSIYISNQISTAQTVAQYRMERIAPAKDPDNVPITYNVTGRYFDHGIQVVTTNLDCNNIVLTDNLSGTLTFINGSDIVTGSGTSFRTELASGTSIRLDADSLEQDVWADVSNIVDNTHLSLSSSYNGSGGGGSGSRISPFWKKYQDNFTTDITVGNVTGLIPDTSGHVQIITVKVYYGDINRFELVDYKVDLR